MGKTPDVFCQSLFHLMAKALCIQGKFYPCVSHLFTLNSSVCLVWLIWCAGTPFNHFMCSFYMPMKWEVILCPQKANYTKPVTITVNKYLSLKFQVWLKNLSKEFLNSSRLINVIPISVLFKQCVLVCSGAFIIKYSFA